jgi:hypothetical protein
MPDSWLLHNSDLIEFHQYDASLFYDLADCVVANNKFHCKKHGMIEQTSSLNRGRVVVRRLEIPGLNLHSASSPEIIPTKIQSSRETATDAKNDKLGANNKNFSRTIPNLSSVTMNAKVKQLQKPKEPEVIIPFFVLNFFSHAEVAVDGASEPAQCPAVGLQGKQSLRLLLHLQTVEQGDLELSRRECQFYTALCLWNSQ